ncbi:mediator of RNA polymerase II transcription subunit 15a-like [Rosa rugosa]|uniref:mediator of RNA polymerase II transcription subunit 15a-like n=1 Tax=Rosa rugosa TaxID=74645 RepID=UPI002B40650D|nr:mediator of RNA polymerase II transcription subunit 15a-like [Rosa rugosa]
METSDWRTQLSTDLRGKVVRKLIDILRKRTPPSEDPLSQLKKIQSIAVKFEEKVYMDSSDQKEYMRKVTVKLMAAEGSHPNVVPKSSPNPPCVGLKPSNLVANQGQSIAVQSTDQSQECEVPEQHSLPDVQNNIACAGVSANLAPARTTVSASAQVLPPSQNPYSLKSVGSSSGKGIPFNESANNFKQEQVKQHSSRTDTPPNPHHCRQVKQEYIDPQQNHKQLNPNLYKQVKQEHDAPSCITQQQKVHQQQHHQQKLLKHTPQQSVIQAPLLRHSELHVSPLSDRQQDQISSFKQTSQSVIKNHHQTAFGQTNPQSTPDIHQKVSSTPEHVLMQSQKQLHVIRSTLTPTNPQQNQLSEQPNGLRDLQQQHHRLPLQHNNLLQEFKGQSIIRSSANHEAQRNNISVRHGSSQLPEGGRSGKHQCEVKMQGETRQTASALLPNEVQKSQPQNLERQLNSQSQPKKMQNLPCSGSMQIAGPASTFGQRISNVDNLQEELYEKVEILKSKYLAELTRVDQKIASHFQKLHSMPQHPERQNIKKLKAIKHMHYTVKFYIMNLNVPKSKITPACKEKLGLLEEKIVSFLQIFEQRKPATLLQHGEPSNVHSMPQSVQLHSQAPQGQTCQDEKKLQSQSVNIQCFDTSMQHSNVTNVVNGSDSLSEPPILQHDTVHLRRNLTEQDSEQANSLKLVNQVPSESFKLPKSSPQLPNDMLSRNPALRLESRVNALESSFSTHQDMHLKWTNEQPDTKTPKQELQRQKSQQQLVQPKQQILQQHHRSPELQSRDLTPNSLPKSLKPSSQQVPQHSSVSEKKNLPMPPMKLKSPVISRSSPEAGISLAPFASTHIPGDSEKPMSETSLVSNAVNIGGQQAQGAPGAIHCSFDGLNAAELPEQPIQRLIKMVNSASCTALSSFASDIGSVVCMTDRMSGPDNVQRSRAAIGDLADMTNFHLQERYFAWQETTVGTRIMKRHRSMPISYGASENSSINDSLSQLSDMENFDLDSPAISYSKRRRLEVNHLLEEITAINQQLIDTVLDIRDGETIPSVASAPILDGEGTIVRCSFIAVAVAPNLKSECVPAPMLAIQPLRLLVPANYPLCSPIFMDKLKVEVSDDQDLLAKVKSKLNFSLRNLTEPLSLGEIARTWDVCARAVISEYAEQNGGGSFSSKYGTWEDCLSAAAA